MRKHSDILTGLLFICLLQIAACNRACPGDRSRLEPGRTCKKPCTSEADCRGALKRCRCDSSCGMTCFNPALTCDPLEAFENGDILGRRGHGETVRYRCNFGYHLDGDSQRTCWADKKWTGRAPRCRRGCRPPRPTDTGYANSFDNFYQIGAVVNYVCRIGYIISGDAQSRCLNSGWWSELQFRCHIIVCDEPPPVANSRRNGTSFEFGRRVSYICNQGYELASENDWLLCDTTGEWFGTVPRCDPVSCLAPQNPVNGRANTIGVEFTYGNLVGYSCSNQYKLVGPSESTCNADRTWSIAPTCEVDIDCDFQERNRATCGWSNSGVAWVQVLHAGAVYYQARFVRGNVETTSKSVLVSPFVSAGSNQCFKIHYRLVEVSASTDFIVNIIEGDSRSQLWSCTESDDRNAWLSTDISILARQANYQIEIVVAKSTVSSIQIDIDNLEVTENGNCQNECEPNSPCLNGGQCLNRIGSFKCICPAGYRGLTCSVEISCLAPVAPVGGSVAPGGRIRVGNGVTYSCSAGHILQGESRRTCTSENNWSHIAPLCRRHQCNERVIQFGSTVPSKRSFQPGETVQFSCNPDYSLSGANHDTCSRTTGAWTNPAPTCIRIFPGNDQQCPPGYQYTSPYCYRVYNDQLTYAEATTICQRAGAHLPIIITAEMFNIVTNINSNTWLGLDDINQEGNIKWSNGVAVAAASLFDLR
ncbi:sushi, von Willebrand factor type A, EGF and pentraxin domain-containing protein 1-like [Ciona intestinalis]